MANVENLVNGLTDKADSMQSLVRKDVSEALAKINGEK